MRHKIEMIMPKTLRDVMRGITTHLPGNLTVDGKTFEFGEKDAETMRFLAYPGPRLTDEEWCQVKDALREVAAENHKLGDDASSDALTGIVCKIMEQQREVEVVPEPTSV